MTQRTVTTLLGVAVAILLVGAAAVVFSLFYTRPVTAQTDTGVQGMRQVTVIGQGEAQGRPDTANVQIGVETQGETAQQALEQNNQQAQAIRDRLVELGIATEDIQTSNFNIHPTYDENGREVVGYRVSNILSVTIRNLDEAGTLLDEVVQVGANSVYGINFSVENPEALLEQARERAVQNAQVRAEQLAQAAGASVGEVLVITENIGSQPPMPLMGRAVAEDTASMVPVEPGEQTFNVQVQVTYELN